MKGECLHLLIEEIGLGVDRNGEERTLLIEDKDIPIALGVIDDTGGNLLKISRIEEEAITIEKGGKPYRIEKGKAITFKEYGEDYLHDGDFPEYRYKIEYRCKKR